MFNYVLLLLKTNSLLFYLIEVHSYEGLIADVWNGTFRLQIKYRTRVWLYFLFSLINFDFFLKLLLLFHYLFKIFVQLWIPFGFAIKLIAIFFNFFVIFSSYFFSDLFILLFVIHLIGSYKFLVLLFWPIIKT